AVVDGDFFETVAFTNFARDASNLLRRWPRWQIAERIHHLLVDVWPAFLPFGFVFGNGELADRQFLEELRHLGVAFCFTRFVIGRGLGAGRRRRSRLALQND